MKPLLEAEDITKVFCRAGKASVKAIDRISFQVGYGETLGIIGESGSGKSTLAKVIARLIDADGGTLRLDGIDMTHLRGSGLKQVYRSIQMVFQTPAGSFNPRRTLGDGICESMLNNGVSWKEATTRAEELLVRCGLPKEFMNRYPHEVSGGQCQRAAIARALAIQPKLLICDEATSSLDATVQKQVIELLHDIRIETGTAILFICHNLALAQQFCDRVLVMYNGKIIEEGTPDEIILLPKAEYTKRLVDAASWDMRLIK